MAEIVKRNKALSVSPLKSSATVGASLAFLGFKSAIPMMHGSQGCTAFGKVFFVRHFREPIPLQTTAMDQISTVMNADTNVVEGLRAISEKSRPALIGVPTTGLSETQGSDVTGAVKEFRQKYPEFEDVAVVPVATPDYTGCLETGWAKAVEEMIRLLVPEGPVAVEPKAKERLVVLPGSALTPGDIDELKDIIEMFGLDPVMLPDLSDSLDGHLPDGDFSPLTTGGADVATFKTIGNARAVLAIGASMTKAAEMLGAKTGLPVHVLPHLMGLKAVDRLVMLLSGLTGKQVPAKLDRQRRRLQDALLDCHFHTGFARIAIAADGDLLTACAELVASAGADVVAAIAPVNNPGLSALPVAEVKIGDLEELEIRAEAGQAQLVIANSHGVHTAERLGVPLMRVGFPQYDLIGGYARTWIGYRGSREALFDLANLLAAEGHGEVTPYKSIYAQKEAWHDGVDATAEAASRRH